MGKNDLNYEAEIKCYNDAWAKFEFHGDNLELATQHVNHIMQHNEVIGFNWYNSFPGQIFYIQFRKKGTANWRYIYTKEKFNPEQVKMPPISELYTAWLFYKSNQTS